MWLEDVEDYLRFRKEAREFFNQNSAGPIDVILRDEVGEPVVTLMGDTEGGKWLLASHQGACERRGPIKTLAIK